VTFLVSTNPIVTISGSTPIAATEGVTPTISIQDSTINQKGAVQLEDSLTSTSITKAAIPKNIKETYEHIAAVSGTLQIDINSKSEVQTFLDLMDSPADYSGHANQYLKVSSNESGLEYVTASGTATTIINNWTFYSEGIYYADFEHNLSTNELSVFIIDTVTNKEVGVEDIEIINWNTVRIYVTDNVSSLKINVITGEFGASQAEYHVVKVAKSGGQFTSIKDALDSIIDSGVFNRYTITVGPGIFAEDNPIQLKPWISIRSTATKEITMVSAQNVNEDLFIGCDRAFASHMVLTGVSSGSALNMSVPGNMIIGDIIVVDCERGIYVNNADAMIEVGSIYAQTYTSTIGEVITVTSGTASIKDLSIVGDSEIETIIKSDAGNVSIFNLWTESSNITNGLYVDNGGKLFGFASQIKGATNSARVGSGGGTLEVVGITVKDSVDYDLLIESPSGTFIGHGCSINRDKLSIVNGADVRSSGYDPYVDTFRTLGDFSVGMDGSGNISQFGEGGSYEYGVKIKTYDGSTYDTLTTYSGIAFPNTISGTCIYIGNSHRFYGIKYGIDIPIDYGSGSIIWEYYDANNSWLEFSVMNTLQYYSDIADVFTCTGESCTLRFDQNIQCGVYESDVTASGITTTTVDGVNGYWVRCRIVSNITNSPEVSAIRLEGNYTVVRANGTRARHGEARSTHIKELIIGTDAAGTANEPLDISSNIVYPYRENEMATAGADEAIFGRFVIPAGCDLSCGLYYSYEVTNKSLPGTDQNVHFIVRAAGITENDKFDGTVNETTLFDSIFTISSTGSAWTIYRKISSYRFDINGFKPGDIIYFKLHRPNDGTDTYTNSMCLANHYISYKVWQDGVQLRCG
jgi:hypothetical protein